MKNKQKSEANKSYEVDLLHVLRGLWLSRKLIGVVFAIFVGTGLLYAVFTPSEYEAKASLLPEMRQQQSASATALIRQFGVGGLTRGLQAGNDFDALRPELYPRIVEATPFFSFLLNEKIYLPEQDTLITVYTYITEHKGRKKIFSTILDYTLRLPSTLRQDDYTTNTQIEEALAHHPFFQKVTKHSKSQHQAIEGMRNRIRSHIDLSSWVIHISVEFPDPIVASQIAQLAVDYLQDYIVEYWTEKSVDDLNFIKDRYFEKQNEFHDAQLRLARHQDANRHIVSATVRAEEQRLQNQYNLAFNRYNELAQKLEDARIQVQRETPVVKLLEPVQIPVERSKPKRMRIMVISAIFGGVAGVSVVFFLHFFKKVHQRVVNQ